MFARFRIARHRLQVSLLETRREAGKVRTTHVASLGAVAAEPDVADRIAFWAALWPRLNALDNRLPSDVKVKIVGDVHARVPMPTADEQRAYQVETFEQDASFWGSIKEAQKEQADLKLALAADVQREVQDHAKEADAAAEHLSQTNDRIAKLRAGESVPGGFTRVDAVALSKALGLDKGIMARGQAMNEMAALIGQESFAVVLRRLIVEERKMGDRYMLKRLRQVLASIKAGAD